ncbi:hypothetical protein ACFQ9X_36315 [Catenulispora yoronensis]
MSASLKDFCGDFAYLLTLNPPDEGSSVPLPDIVAYDRATSEAPAAVKTDMTIADTAVHAAAATAKAGDLRRLTDAVNRVSRWAMAPDNCHLSSQ